MKRRTLLIVALLLAILVSTIGAVLRGQGTYLLNVLVAFGLWSLFGLLLLMRWTLSLQFWGQLAIWFRRRRR
jgi:hypothetical protein